MNNRRACTWKNVNHFAQCMHFTRYRCFFPIACARCSPWCIVTSINNVFWFIQTTEFVCSSDRLKLKGCIVAHRRIKIFTISIFGLDVKFHSTNIHRNIDLIICQTLMSFLVRIYVIHVWWFIHRLLIFYCTLPLSLSLFLRANTTLYENYFCIPSERVTTHFLRSWLCTCICIGRRYEIDLQGKTYVSNIFVKFLFE